MTIETRTSRERRVIDALLMARDYIARASTEHEASLYDLGLLDGLLAELGHEETKGGGEP